MKENRLLITSFRILVLVLAIFHLPSSILHGQSITNSPYSRYGLGDLQYGGFVNNIALGGISNALQNDTAAPFFINQSNPASLPSTRLTVFELGIKNNTTTLETTDKKYTSNQNALAYMALAFPVAKWWGASFGLLPYSNVGYKIYDVKEQESIGTVHYSYEGEGGINQLYLGNGFRIKNFSAGVNVSYLFGDLVYFSRDSFPKTSDHLNTKVSQTNRVSDLLLSFGAQYRKPLKREWSVTLGATGSMSSDINVKQSTFAAGYKNDFGVEVIKDTVINEKDVKDTITIPLMFGGGIVVKKGEKWLFGVDYSIQNWSEFDSFNQQGVLKNSSKLAVGIQYIPNKNAGTKELYVKKIFYRAGFRYSDSYLELNNSTIKDYAITFGAGFPLRKIKIGEMYSQSLINIGFEIGQRGTIENQLVREKYFNAFVSFTLNDRWFIKRKYD